VPENRERQPQLAYHPTKTTRDLAKQAAHAAIIKASVLLDEAIGQKLLNEDKDVEHVAALANAAATLGNAWASLAATIDPDESVGN